ncbi:MAG: hypothetical protein M1825_001889 [Sarcosagium campestre]|nr:MAG: hypothetical protein M1825_001889 [Sarcosagium campestre]
MSELLDAREVAKHNSINSCWVILYGHVYDVTGFLPNHPGGSKAILQLAGRDATEEYDPVHPPGTLEDALPIEAKLGKVDHKSLPNLKSGLSQPTNVGYAGPPPLDTLLNLDDIEKAAKNQISKKAWAYYYSAGDDLISKRLNTDVYRSILLRPRVFVDCEKCSTDTKLLDQSVNIPIYASPAAMARFAHPTGEAGIAQACGKFGAMQLISYNASMTPEQIVQNAAPGQVFGWQMYVQTERKKSENMLARINLLQDKIKVICLTLDAPVPGKREHDERAKNIASDIPVTAAVQAGSAVEASAGNSESIARQLFMGTSPKLTWKETLSWLSQHTKLPIVLKGIQTHEDAYLASLYTPQVRGVILSNHGGRAADTAPPAIHTLLEIRKYCPEVLDKIEVWLDGGIKRGTDVVKALCLGAKAVGIGRAPLWGLAAGGPEGVERTLEILKAEVETCMRLLGASSVKDLGPKHINARAVEGQIYDGPPGLEKPGPWFGSKL